jgi:hypothetical protein
MQLPQRVGPIDNTKSESKLADNWREYNRR